MRHSKILLVLFAVALSIIACYDSGTYVTSMPIAGNSAASQKASADYAMQQAQQQEANAYAAAANETAQAHGALAAMATADAASFSSTQSAVFAQQTSQAIEAKATIDAQAILLAQQQAQVNATAQAMQREGLAAEQAARASQRQSELISWLIPIVAAITFGLVLLLGTKLFGGMIDAANERRSLENQRLALLGTLFEAPSETIVFADEPQLGFTTPHLLDTAGNGIGYETSGSVSTSLAPLIDTEASPVIVMLSSNDKLLADRAEVREEAARYKLAMKLIRDAINHVGAQSNRIPQPAQLGWPVGAWTIAVAILRPYGVEILHGLDGGIYLVGQYPTLQSLYIAIGERRLTLYPPSAEIVTNS